MDSKNNIHLKLWSTQNIQSVRDIHTSWKGDKHRQSNFGKLPWEIIRDIILPMTIERKDTIKLINKKKEEEEKKEEELIQILLNIDNEVCPCKRPRN